MDRRSFNKKLLIGASASTLPGISLSQLIQNPELRASDFGKYFEWGCASAAFQTEGAWQHMGKGLSIWDKFTHTKGKIHTGENAEVASDFYNRYDSDIQLLKDMNFGNFRFSLAWTRLLPQGIGKVNQNGIDFYHRVIDSCLEKGITPWVTLYHWDLPQVLQDKGGWTNREIINWFSEYANLATKSFGDKVKNWMVLNEPAAFVGLGYGSGYHAPGEKSVKKFIKASHHAVMCQAVGGRIIRNNVSEANIGTTFSCSEITPLREGKDQKAARKFDALYNRLYIEPSLGMGYPIEDLPAIKSVEKYIIGDDETKMKFDFDFIGLQNYFRVVAKQSLLPPVLWAKEIPADERNVEMNTMGFEIYPQGIHTMLKKFGNYPGVKKIIITENGTAVPDQLIAGKVDDKKRLQFFKDYLQWVLKAKNDGVPIEGYFAWSLTDNFEWSEGYDPRFGLIYVDFESQERTIKKSGYWWQEFLKK